MPLDGLFEQHLSELEGGSAHRDPSIARSVCLDANQDILQFQRLLGFLLRSTNVRNPFELYDPMYRLAKQWLGSEAKLVLSSEWEFSPFTYPATFVELPGFSFIGLPATEADNVLIFPLAGHELGHSVWVIHKLSKRLEDVVQAAVLRQFQNRWEDLRRFLTFLPPTVLPENLEKDLVLRNVWVGPFRWSMNQCEEIMCDFIGLRTFGASFMHSFEYLVAPSFGPTRLDLYPPLGSRIGFMLLAADRFGFRAPDGFSARFSEPKGRFGSGLDQLLMAISQAATDSVVPELLNIVDDLAQETKIPVPSTTGSQHVFDRLRRLRPAEKAASLADIIDAGWDLYLAREQFCAELEVTSDRWFETLNELLCKSIEVFEYERKLEDAA